MSTFFPSYFLPFGAYGYFHLVVTVEVPELELQILPEYITLRWGRILESADRLFSGDSTVYGSGVNLDRTITDDYVRLAVPDTHCPPLPQPRTPLDSAISDEAEPNRWVVDGNVDTRNGWEIGPNHGSVSLRYRCYPEDFRLRFFCQITEAPQNPPGPNAPFRGYGVSLTVNQNNSVIVAFGAGSKPHNTPSHLYGMVYYISGGGPGFTERRPASLTSSFAADIQRSGTSWSVQLYSYSGGMLIPMGSPISLPSLGVGTVSFSVGGLYIAPQSTNDGLGPLSHIPEFDVRVRFTSIQTLSMSGTATVITEPVALQEAYVLEDIKTIPDDLLPYARWRYKTINGWSSWGVDVPATGSDTWQFMVSVPLQEKMSLLERLEATLRRAYIVVPPYVEQQPQDPNDEVRRILFNLRPRNIGVYYTFGRMRGTFFGEPMEIPLSVPAAVGILHRADVGISTTGLDMEQIDIPGISLASFLQRAYINFIDSGEETLLIGWKRDSVGRDTAPIITQIVSLLYPHLRKLVGVPPSDTVAQKAAEITKLVLSSMDIIREAKVTTGVVDTMLVIEIELHLYGRLEAIRFSVSPALLGTRA